MNSKNVLFGAVGLIGIGGLLYGSINKYIDNMDKKREEELRELEKEWHHAGYTAGYDDGKRDAELDAMIKSSKDNQGV